MTSSQFTIFLSLGSNLGDRQGNLENAVSFLNQRLRIEKVSSVYETEPVDVVNQPKFLNMVCKVATGLSPTGLLFTTQGIENKLGRPPNTHNAPRPIDIDILFYGNQVVTMPNLVIPHPRIAERAFVLVPLTEIAPDFVHPVLHKTVKVLLKALGPVMGVNKVK